jgi:predicted hydrocarbon binding protein
MTENVELANKAFRVILLAVEDVVGKNGTSAILRQANLAQYIDNYPPSNMEHGGHKLEYMSRINRALFDVYGRRGARAILQRSGKSRALDAIAENGVVANATKIAAKLLSRRRKVKLLLDTAAKEYSEQLGTTIRIEDDGEFFYWQDDKCGNCIDWQSEQPVCFTTVGFIHGLVAWILEDENFKVEEIACRAVGAPACRYQVKLN